MISTQDHSKAATNKNAVKTKLLPIPVNSPIDILDNAKRIRMKNSTATPTIDDDIVDDDEDEIQGDASGITIPLSKSLGN